MIRDDRRTVSEGWFHVTKTIVPPPGHAACEFQAMIVRPIEEDGEGWTATRRFTLRHASRTSQSSKENEGDASARSGTRARARPAMGERLLPAEAFIRLSTVVSGETTAQSPCRGSESTWQMLGACRGSSGIHSQSMAPPRSAAHDAGRRISRTARRTPVPRHGTAERTEVPTRPPQRVPNFQGLSHVPLTQ